MTLSVYLLDAASHNVKLMVGLSDDGITNGNNATPAVRIVPTTANDMVTKPSKVRCLLCNAKVAKTHRYTSAGNIHKAGIDA